MARSKSARRKARQSVKRVRPHRCLPIKAHAAANSLTILASEDTQAKTCEILAYTGGKLNLPNFKIPVVIELESASFEVNPLLLLRHDFKIPVGHLTEHNITASEITAKAVLSCDCEERDSIVQSAKDGFPWGASIGGDPGRIEEVAAGVTININGQNLTGPFLIAHDTVLREISICSRGLDSNTRVSVAAQLEGEIDMTFEQWMELLELDPTKMKEAVVAELQIAFNAKVGADVEVPATDTPDEDEEVAAAEDEGETEEEKAAAAEKEKEKGKVKASKDTATPQPGQRVIQTTADEMKSFFATAIAPAVQVKKRPGRQLVIEAALRINAGRSPDEMVDDYDETVLDAADSPNMRGYGLRALFAEVAGPEISNHAFSDSTIRAALETTRHESKIQATGFSTISLPNVLSNLQGKELRRAYDQYTGPSLQLMRTASASDFKLQTSIRFSMGGGLSELGPGGEIKDSSSAEDTYTSQVETKAEMYTLTRQMMINDDIGAFTAIPGMYGLKAARSIDIAFHTLLLANTGTFFGTGNKNKSTTALSIDGLTAAELLFLDQVDVNGDPIINIPKFLVVPSALSTTGKNLMNSTQVNETTSSDTPSPSDNPHANAYEIVVSPYLGNANFSGSSAVDWYLWSDPAIVSPFVITYLNGQRRPTIENADVDFNKLGMSFRCYFDFGIDQDDYRGAVKADV